MVGLTRRRILRRALVRQIDLDEVRLVAAFPLAAGGGEVIAAGTDVTATARDWTTLDTHLHRGTIVAVPKGPAAAQAGPGRESDEPGDEDTATEGEQPTAARGKRRKG